jgi:hypothetical protein
MNEHERSQRLRQVVHQLADVEQSLTEIATDTLVRAHDAEVALKWLQRVDQLARLRADIEAGLEYLDVASFRPH